MNTDTESGLLMQWQQTLKEGPGCNQLLLPALGHRPENIEECHCIAQLRTQMKSSAVLVYKFRKDRKNNRIFANMTLPWKLGNPAPVQTLYYKHTGAAFLILSHYATDFLAEPEGVFSFFFFF